MNILLVRHGETAWNREGRYQGRTDIPLSEVGLEQVKRLGDKLAGVTIDVAISSPLARARATAEAALGGRASPLLELDAGLVEISHGDWEGMLSSEVERSHAEMFGTWRNQPGRDVPAGPGAETLGDVEARAWAVLERLAPRLGFDGTALVVAHDAVNRAILCRVLGMTLEHVWKFRQSPATLNLIVGPKLDALHVVRLNDADQPLLSETAHRAL